MLPSEAAQLYALQGYRVLPLCWPSDAGECACGQAHPPKGAGKAPLLPNGVLDASSDAEQIKRWWTRWPGANIGIALAPARALVIDLDTPAAEAEADGLGVNGQYTISTGRGRHVWTQLPQDGHQARVIHAGESRAIDLLADGYAIVAPSRHRSGPAYCWMQDRWLAPSSQLPIAPTWAVGLLAEAVEARAKQDHAPIDLPEIDATSLPSALSFAGRCLWTGEEAIRTSDEQIDRSATLYALAKELLRAEASVSVTAGLLAYADNALGYAKFSLRSDANERYLATAERAAQEIAREPRAILSPKHTRLRGAITAVREATDQKFLRFSPHTDAGNAEVIAGLYGGEMLWDADRKSWMLYDSRRGLWARDTSGQAFNRARDAARARYLAGQEDGQLAGWARKSEDLYRLRAALELAGPLMQPAGAWDNHPHSLHCANGVLDLRSGLLDGPTPDMLLTRTTGIPYDGRAEAPRWQLFLREVFGSNEPLIAFMQRAVGYSLAGVTSEQCFFLLYGSGANGKTTFLNVLRALVGGDTAGYAQVMSFQALDYQARNQVPVELANLPGKRLATVSEMADGTRLHEGRIKSLTGSEPITARGLWERPMTFAPAAKLWLAVNHKPVVSDDSYGLWRRVRLVPFLRRFVEKEVDPGLEGKLLRELPGILAWAVAGAIAWYRHGLEAPPIVLEATATYKQESDPLSDFVSGCCREHPDEWTAAGELYRRYTQWADDVGLRHREIMTSTTFGRRMAERYAKAATRTGIVYHGVGIRPAAVATL